MPIAMCSRFDASRPGRSRWCLPPAVVLFACATLTASPAAGQAPGPSLPATLTLDAALQFAADHYPSVRMAMEHVSAAGAGVDAARTAYLPRLDSVWQTNRGTVNNITGPLLPQSVVPGISGPPLPGTAAGTVWGTAAGALLSWEAFDLGLRGASLREAEAAVVRARADQALTRLQVQHGVGVAFLTLAAAQQAVVAADADVERRTVLARTARALADAQLRPGAEASRADAERAAAETRAIQARQAVALADATLARLLGTAAASPAIDVATLLARTPAATDVQAAPLHPWLDVRQATVDAAVARDEVLAVTFRPRVFFQAAASARGSGAESDGRLTGGGLGLERVNWAAGVQVVFPNLFEASAIRARRQSAAAIVRAERARLDETRLALTAEQRAAEAVVAAARAIAANMPVQLAAAHTSEAQARARYEAGLAALVEVADTQALLAAAEYQAATARVEVWRALLARAVATDTLEAFIASVRGRE